MRCLHQLLFYVAIAFATVGITAEAQSQTNVAAITDEAELLKIISGDAPKGDKALACKRLAIYGSPAAVPELAKLLSDAELHSWTRIALEAIPGKESNAALQAACNTLKGRLLIGVINSLGVRRDASAVETLSKKLNDNDAEVVGAAAVALGKIGGTAAADLLRSALANASDKAKSTVAEGCVLCAEQFLASGDSKTALAIYEEVRKAPVHKQRIVEATRGAILSSPNGVALLKEQLQSQDKMMFQVGLGTAREMTGKEVATALLAEIDKATPERAALMVQALADLKGKVDIPTILKLANGPAPKVRIAAIEALGRVGDGTCVEPLLKLAADPNAELSQTVKSALVNIQDESVSTEILSRLPKSTGTMQKLLIELVGLRRIDATSELTKALSSTDAGIRTAAIESLGSTVSQDKMTLLIDQVKSPKSPEDASVARLALKTAAVRMPDREVCAAMLADAMSTSSTATKVTLLEILAEVGGNKALETVGAAARSPEVQLKDVGTSLLGKWMTTDAAPVLLDLAKTGPLDKFQVRAMKGYIRIIKQFIKQEPERLDMCAKAFEAAKQPDELKLIIEVLKLNPSVGTLKLALGATKTTSIKDEAIAAAKAIAQKLGDNAEAKELMTKAGL
jgi:HEAT repeat protein